MNELDSWLNEPLDSRQLLAFMHVAATGSFTLAARRMYLSQSAVSHSIKALEETVACRLFDRVGKKAILTLAGENLLHHSSRIFREMTIARESLSRLGKWGTGRLRIGAGPTACQSILPSVLREFKDPYPDYQITIQPGDTPVLLEALRAKRIDVALTLEPERSEDFEIHTIFRDELQFITAPTHPWAVRGKAQRDEIARQNYILYHRSSQTGAIVDDYFRSERIVLKTVIELGSMEAIKELVKLGLGVSILAPWIAHAELESQALVALPLGSRKLSRRWAVLQSKGKRPSLAEETFIGLCRSVTENISIAAGRLSRQERRAKDAAPRAEQRAPALKP